MLIILEGPDNGGKSTLAERVKEAEGLEYLPMLNGRTQDHATSRKKTYAALRTNMGRRLVCERFHPISDAIYRDLDAGARIFSRFEEQQIFAELGKQRAQVVYCRPVMYAMESTVHHPENDDTEDWCRLAFANLSRIVRSYDLMMARLAKLGVAVIWYDWTDPWAEDILKECFPCAV